MANTQLRRYIAERLLELDPSLSDASGSPMYTKVIDPLLARLGTDLFDTDIETFITQRIMDDNPNLDIMSAGSFASDIIAKPLIAVLTPIIREIKHFATQQSLVNTDQLTDDEIDALVANLFVTRKSGSYSEGIARVYFNSARPQFLDASIVFSTSDGIQFIPTEAKAFAPSDFKASGNQYYIDVPIQSAVPHSGANVGAGLIKFVTGLTGVVRVTNPTKMTGGITRETNQQLLDRAPEALTERSPTTARGISTFAHDAFGDSIASIEVVGFGDKEMTRDILSADISLPDMDKVGEVIRTTSAFTVSEMSELSTPRPPISNKITLTNTISAPRRDEMLDAKFIRVIEAGGSYDDRISPRIRAVSEVVHSGNDTVITLADFELLSDGTATTSMYDASTNSPGEQLKAVNGTSSYWVGAPLPFTDVVQLSETVGDIEPGRDFLIFYGKDNPARTYVRPVKRKIGASKIQVGRADSFFVSKRRVPYTSDYEFSLNRTNAGMVEGINVIAFGSADYENGVSASLDGELTAGNLGRHGGCTLIVKGASDIVLAIPTSSSRPYGWSSLGVQEGDYICVAAFVDSAAISNPLGGTVAPAYPKWMGWGIVTQIGGSGLDGTHQLRVVGIPRADIPNGLLGYNSSDSYPRHLNSDSALNDEYGLNWTVYRGVKEMILPDGTLYNSYDEFAFLPAFTFASDGPQPYMTNDPRFVCDYDGTTGTNQQLNDAGDNEFYYALIRLRKNYFDELLDGTNPVHEVHVYPECVHVIGDEVHPDATRPDFDSANYYIFNFASNPFNAFAHGFTWSGSDFTGMTRTSLTNNTRAATGYLLSSEIDAATSHIVQLYREAVVDTSDYKIVVSGMPGSVPFPNSFNGPVEVDPNEIHIGGMVDVYVKERSDTVATQSISLLPSTMATAQFKDANGYITEATPDMFGSMTLAAYVSSIDLSFAALIITYSTEDTLISSTHRILGIVYDSYGGVTGVRLDGDIWQNGMPSTVSDIEFSIYTHMATSITDGYYCLASGNDAYITTTGSVISLPSGSNIRQDPSITALYLVINDTKYRITAIDGSNITIDGTVIGPNTDVVYFLVADSNSITLPLSVIRNITSAGSSNTPGEVIPSNVCVVTRLLPVAGLNNDPVTSASGTLRGSDPAVFQDSSVDFENLGITENCVLHITSAPEEYYRVVEVSGNTLTLDRPLRTARSGVSYRVGHPAVGTVKMYFADPTYVSVTEEVEFSTADGQKFMPSYAESATVYTSKQSTTSLSITPSPSPGVTATTLTTTDDDVQRHGIKEGDVVTILAAKLKSTVSAPTTVNVSGASITFNLNGLLRTVTFTGPNPLTLDAAIQQINNVIAPMARAKSESGYLCIYSKDLVTITAVSPTAATAFGLSVGMTNEKFASGTLTVSYVTYDGEWTIGLMDSVSDPVVPANDPYTEEVFIKVVRPNMQHSFPADMVKDTNGFYYASFTVVSRAPWDGSMLAEQDVSADGYFALGYSCVPINRAYTYSTAEELLLDVTACVMPATATKFGDAFAVVGTEVEIEYAHSPTAAALQNLLMFPTTRTVCSNPLVRTFMPALARINISCTGGTDIEGAVGDYLASLYPNRTLEMYDLMRVLDRAGCSNVKNPIDMAYLVYDAYRVPTLRLSTSSLSLDKGNHIYIDDLSVSVNKA